MEFTCDWGVIISVFADILVYAILSGANRQLFEDVMTVSLLDDQGECERKAQDELHICREADKVHLERLFPVTRESNCR